METLPSSIASSKCPLSPLGSPHPLLLLSVPAHPGSSDLTTALFLSLSHTRGLESVSNVPAILHSPVKTKGPGAC